MRNFQERQIDTTVPELGIQRPEDQNNSQNTDRVPISIINGALEELRRNEIPSADNGRPTYH